MIIDAMDILYKEKVDCFCLATSDSDFTKLAMRFRNDNLIVIGAGEKKTPDSFRRACDRFIPIDELLAAKEGADKVEAEPVAEKKEAASVKTIEQKEKPKQTKKAMPSEVEKKLAKLIEMALKIVIDGAESDGWMHFSTFMNEVYRKENGFNPKLYGHSNSTPSSFFRSLADKTGKEVFMLDRTNNYDRIKLNK